MKDSELLAIVEKVVAASTKIVERVQRLESRLERMEKAAPLAKRAAAVPPAPQSPKPVERGEPMRKLVTGEGMTKGAGVIETHELTPMQKAEASCRRLEELSNRVERTDAFLESRGVRKQ